MPWMTAEERVKRFLHENARNEDISDIILADRKAVVERLTRLHRASLDELKVERRLAHQDIWDIAIAEILEEEKL